jgi:LPS export ABC transporter permease LptG
MKICDRYILRELVFPFLAGLVIVITIILAHTMLKSSDIIFRSGVPLSTILLWLVYRIPVVCLYALPVATMLGVSLTVIRLTRDNELTALRMGGMSLLRAFGPLVGGGCFFSGLSFVDSEFLAPWSADRAQTVLRESILHAPDLLVKPSLPFRGDEDTFFHVRQVDVRTNTLYAVVIYRLRSSHLAEVLIAERLQRLGSQWMLFDGRQHLFDRIGNKLDTVAFESRPIQLRRDIQHLWSNDKLPEQMTAREIRDLAQVLQATGVRDRGSGEASDEVEMWKFHFYTKFSLPLACLVIALLSAPLSFRFARTGTFSGILLTIAVVFLYNGTMNWSKVFALQGYLNPVFAAFSHNLVFGLAGLVLLFKK